MSTPTIKQHFGASGAITYPMNHVLGILPDPADGPTVKAELQAAGFAEDAVCMLSGADGCSCMDAEGDKHGPLVRLMRWWQHFTPEYAHLASYEEAIRDGHCVVAVRAHHHLDWEAIQRVLTAHGGHYIHFYGWMIHDLVP